MALAGRPAELLCDPLYQLLDDGTGEKELRADAREHRDFSCLFQGSWERLVQWHGGGPAICRPVTVADGRRTMELQPMKLKVLCSSDSSKELNVAIFKKVGWAEQEIWRSCLQLLITRQPELTWAEDHLWCSRLTLPCSERWRNRSEGMQAWLGWVCWSR